MSQYDFGNLSSPLPGATFIDDNLEPWRDALNSLHKGNVRPSYAVQGIMWIDDSVNPWLLKIYDGSDDIQIGTLNPATNAFTPSGVNTDLVNDTSPQLGGDLDLNGHVITGMEIGTDIQAYDADTAKTDVTQTFTKAQRASVTTLTSTSNHIAINFADNNDFTHTTTENTTLDNPSNIAVGQSGVIYFIQGGTPYTLLFGSYWDFAGGSAPALTTSASARDALFYHAVASDHILATLVKNWS